MRHIPMTRTDLVLIVAAIIAVIVLAVYWRQHLSPSAAQRQEAREKYEAIRASDRNDPIRYLADPDNAERARR